MTRTGQMTCTEFQQSSGSVKKTFLMTSALRFYTKVNIKSACGEYPEPSLHLIYVDQKFWSKNNVFNCEM